MSTKRAILNQTTPPERKQPTHPLLLTLPPKFLILRFGEVALAMAVSRGFLGRILGDDRPTNDNDVPPPCGGCPPRLPERLLAPGLSVMDESPTDTGASLSSLPGELFMLLLSVLLPLVTDRPSGELRGDFSSARTAATSRGCCCGRSGLGEWWLLGVRGWRLDVGVVGDCATIFHAVLE